MRVTTGNHVTATVPEGVVVNSGSVNANITNASINANVTGDVNVTNGNINITDSAERLLGKTNLTKNILLANNATITTTAKYFVSIDNAKTIMVLLTVKSLSPGTSFNMMIWARHPELDLRAIVDVTPWNSDTGSYCRVYNVYTNYYAIYLNLAGTTPSMTFDLGVVLRS